jgi:hypothetical protein
VAAALHVRAGGADQSPDSADVERLAMTSEAFDNFEEFERSLDSGTSDPPEGWGTEERPTTGPGGYWPTEGSILKLTTQELRSYPDACPTTDCPASDAIIINLPAVVLDVGNGGIAAYYVCRTCFTGWWTGWTRQDFEPVGAET